MFHLRYYKNTSSSYKSRLKRTDSLAMLRQRRRIVANDERRVCIDRCATLTTTPSQLLHYVMRLRGCTETQRDILALLIHNRLPLRLSKEWIDALFSSDSISIIIDCLMVDDPKDLLRTCAGQIIAQIIAHDNAAHANGLQQYTLQANIVLPTDDSYATIRLQLVSQLLHIFGRTLNSIVANLIDDVIRKMIERAEFDDSMCWSDRILPPIRELLMGPMQSDRVLQIGLQFLALLTDGCGFRNRINHIVRYKFVPVLIRSITGPVAIQLVGLHVIKNISQGYDENIMDLLNGNLLVALKEILLASSALAGVRHLALDILSSLCGHRTEVAAIINAGLLPIVLDVMLNDDNELQILASCVVNNIANRGGIGEIMQAVQCGTVVALCKMLHRTDNDIISNVLDALHQILISLRRSAMFQEVIQTIEELYGLSKIEHLQNHENSDIRMLASEIHDTRLSHENNVLSICDVANGLS